MFDTVGDLCDGVTHAAMRDSSRPVPMTIRSKDSG